MGKRKFKQTEIGKIPEDLEVLELRRRIISKWSRTAWRIGLITEEKERNAKI